MMRPQPCAATSRRIDSALISVRRARGLNSAFEQGVCECGLLDTAIQSDPSGRFSTAGGDTTCGNWTKSGEGSAIVGHSDRQGLKDTWHMKSWNSSHGSRGCSQEQLKASGGAGLLYCFVPN